MRTETNKRATRRLGTISNETIVDGRESVMTERIYGRDYLSVDELPSCVAENLRRDEEQSSQALRRSVFEPVINETRTLLSAQIFSSVITAGGSSSNIDGTNSVENKPRSREPRATRTRRKYRSLPLSWNPTPRDRDSTSSS